VVKVAEHRELAGLRILLVEENAASRAMFAAAVARFGMKAAESSNAEQAIQLMQEASARGVPFEVAVLDTGLPDTDGFALARRIKSDPTLQRTRIILVAAVGQRGHGRETQEAGGSAYLTKPVRESDLYDCIVAAITIPTGTAGNEPAAPLITRHVIAAARARLRSRLLLVDDNEVNQMLAVELLEREGYRVDVASNGRDALKALALTDYAAVLMDCQMPEMDGFEATATIRKGEAPGRHVPIIAMTANAMQGDRERCLASGMDDYLSKPIEQEKLYETVRRCIAAGPDERPPAPEASPPSSLNGSAEAAVEPSVVDLGQLQLLFANDTGKIRKFLHLFVKTAEPALRAMDTAVLARNGNDVRMQAHKLRGSAANVGASAVANLAAELEQMDPTGDWSAAEDLRVRLWHTFTQTREFAHGY
jgi:CheY-like chemotaxis protein/HPt (histidine-containing phosphotransfer) domain-containing protein